MNDHLSWYLSHVVPPALSDLAILVQEALCALASASPSSAPLPDCTLPVSSHFNDPVSVNGSISLNQFTITRSNIDIKFPSRPLIHLTIDQCKLLPVMEAHHLASLVLSILHTTMPPFSFHTILALTNQLGSSLQSALAHVRHNHRTIGPAQCHPLAAPTDLCLGVATAIAGDYLVLTLASLVPTPIPRTTITTSIGTGSTNLGEHGSSTSLAANVAILAPPTRLTTLRESHSHHHGRNPSVSSVGSANSMTRTGSPRPTTATPPPLLASQTHPSRSLHSSSATGGSASTASLTLPPSSSPLAGAKVRASHSLRSALSSVVGIHHSHSPAPDTSPSPLSLSDGSLSTANTNHAKAVYQLGNAWHEVQYETCIEIGWKPLVEFRDKLAAALALNRHIAAQVAAFTRIANANANANTNANTNANAAD